MFSLSSFSAAFRRQVSDSEIHRQSSISTEDLLLCDCINLENDEVDLRSAVECLEDDTRQRLVFLEGDERQHCMWDGRGSISLQQIGFIFSSIFKQMLALGIGSYATMFPRGVKTLTAERTTLGLLALQIIDMAFVDTNVQSFCLSVLPGVRISVNNCPPNFLATYFHFMAFKVWLHQAQLGVSDLVELKRCVEGYFLEGATLEITVPPRLDKCFRALVYVTECVGQHHLFAKMAQGLHQRLSLLDDDTKGSMSGRDQLGGLSWTRGECIGRGAFGAVYKVLNVNTGELMAMKEIVSPDDRTAREIETEVRIMRRLKNPHIVSYYGSEVMPYTNTTQIFMELVPGGSLESLLRKFGAFQESTIVVYVRQILRGLRYLHNNGIIHRDIKCGNILVNDKGIIKVGDFGLSSDSTAESTSIPGYIHGTTVFLSPEVIRGCTYSESSDIWAVGCVIIEMATAQRPWAEVPFENKMAALYHIAHSGTIPQVPSHLGPEAHSFIASCLQLDPCCRATTNDLLAHPFLDSQLQRAMSQGEVMNSSLVGENQVNSDHVAYLQSQFVCSAQEGRVLNSND